MNRDKKGKMHAIIFECAYVTVYQSKFEYKNLKWNETKSG